ncbi:MAG: hypothetical protein ACRER5_11340, partial [Pseudomonas sp.]
PTHVANHQQVTESSIKRPLAESLENLNSPTLQPSSTESSRSSSPEPSEQLPYHVAIRLGVEHSSYYSKRHDPQ